MSRELDSAVEAWEEIDADCRTGIYSTLVLSVEQFTGNVVDEQRKMALRRAIDLLKAAAGETRVPWGRNAGRLGLAKRKKG